MRPMHPDELTRLLDQSEWVRGVARAVLGDPAEADDVVQDTYLKTLSDGPRDGAKLVHWFRKVGRNLSLERLRTRRRRERLDARQAHPGAAAAAAEVVEKAQVHRIVVEAVLALDEPYRTTILLRFFDDLEPLAIAAKLGVPASTVRVRLMRALEILRPHLAARIEDEQGVPWRASLAVLAGLKLDPVPASGPSAGAAFGGAKTLQAAAAAAILMVGVVALRPLFDVETDADVDLDSVASLDRPAGRSEATRRSALVAPDVSIAAEPVVTVEAKPLPDLSLMSCSPAHIPRSNALVLSVQGAAGPLAGAEVAAGTTLLGFTADDGNFHLDRTDTRLPTPLVLAVHAAGHAASRVEPKPWDLVTVVRLLQPFQLRVAVTDSEGRPVVGAAVALSGGQSDQPLPTAPLGTDFDGRIDAGFVPAGRVRIHVSHPDFVAAHDGVAGAVGQTVEHTVRLEAGRAIAVRFVDQAGDALAGVQVTEVGFFRDGEFIAFGAGTEASAGVFVFTGAPQSAFRGVVRFREAGVDEVQSRTFDITGPDQTETRIVAAGRRLAVTVSVSGLASSWNTSLISQATFSVALSGPDIAATRVLDVGAGGTTRFAGLAPEQLLSIEVRDRDVVLATRELSMPKSGHGAVTIALPPVHSVGFEIVDRRLPPAAYSIRLDRISGAGAFPRSVERTADPDGFVRFFCPLGVYDYTLIFDGREFPGTSPMDVRGVTKLAVSVPRIGVIEGRIVTAEGRPLGGWVARVDDRQFRGQSVLTDADGRFEFSNLAPGPYRLSTWPRAASTVHVLSESIIPDRGASEHRVAIRRVRGRVVDFETGDGVAARLLIHAEKASFSDTDIGPDGLALSGTAASDSEGYFDVELPYGKWIFNVGEGRYLTHSPFYVEDGRSLRSEPNRVEVGDRAALDLLVYAYSAVGVELAQRERTIDRTIIKWTARRGARVLVGEVSGSGSNEFG